ncbi:MAG: DeoR/GlpR transcriptional regulator, partial [Actinobacteria bacterium]|nr:DeoR/GlpR transcriptional regulator [Actinomycetota bacterium]
MNTNERRKKIVEIIRENKDISVEEISKKISISIPTVYRDLDILDKNREIERYYGGLRALEGNKFERNYYKRYDINKEQKTAIAKEAVKLIEENETIVLDESTTVHYLAREIKKIDIKLTIITNSILLLPLFANSSNIDVISTGGIVNKEIAGMVGSIAECSISNIFADKFFFSSAGISWNAGVLDAYIPENIKMKEQFFKIAAKSICLVDSSKFQKSGTVNWVNYEKLKY